MDVHDPHRVRGSAPVSAKAVSKAVATGRLSASVTRDQHGAPKISDPDLADREWSANTRARIDRASADRLAALSALFDRGGAGPGGER